MPFLFFIVFSRAGDRGLERDAQVRPAVRAAGDGDAADGQLRPRGYRLRTQTPSGLFGLVCFGLCLVCYITSVDSNLYYQQQRCTIKSNNLTIQTLVVFLL